jgi:drug/metabolite transporter (DMT)-like permease
MRFFRKLIGLAPVLSGIYFLGQNILFTTQLSRYWYRDLSAIGSVLALASGILTLLFARRGDREMGWMLVGIGIILVFLSSGVILRPTSLWTFFLAFIALAGGFKLITGGRLEF